MKKQAVLVFFVGEFYWEVGRFAPYIIWKRKKQYKNKKDIDFIVFTRPENFDLYGRYADVLVPFKLKDTTKYKANCFRLDNLSEHEYFNIISNFRNHFSDRYIILETIYPDITKTQYSNKNQFPKDKMIYEYLPRVSNEQIINKVIDERKVVILGPRYREGFKRNWPYWQELYNYIFEDQDLFQKYNFVICGKNPDYVSDVYERFLDINKIEQNINTSLAGYTIELMKKASLTIGSQSAIPNISLLFNVPVLEWGHQKHLHTIIYNVKKTKITFLEDNKYNIDPKTIYYKIKELLK